VVGISSATRLATRGDRSCALSGGKLLCWGKLATRVVNDASAGTTLGVLRGPRKTPEVSLVPLAALVDSVSTPERAPGLLGLSSLSTTAHGFCALFPTAAGGSELKCRGRDALLGVGTFWANVPDVGKLDVRQVVSRSQLACALMSDGRVTCRADKNEAWRQVPDVSDVQSLALGDGFACAADGAGAVWCWGANDVGQLGTGTRQASQRPQRAVGVSDATKLAIARNRVCALRSGGEVMCWGGSPSYFAREEPAKPPALPARVLSGTFADVSASQDQICGLRGDGALACLGEYGSETPAAPRGLAGAAQLSVARRGGCALDAEGQALCWGENDAGQLGSGRQSRGFASPVLGLPKLKQLQIHGDQVCALSLSGELWCWGGRR